MTALHRGLAASSLLLLLAADGAVAQARDSVAAAERGRAAPGEVRPIQAPLVGVRYGSPLRASLYGGWLIGTGDGSGYRGYSMVTEVGQAGLRLSGGLTRFGDGGTLRLEAGVLRTWGSPSRALPGATYLGAEVLATRFWVLGGSVGFYTLVGEREGASRHFWSLAWVLGL